MGLSRLFLAATAILVVTPASAASASLAKLPLRFEANQGQLPAEVKFFARAPGYQVHLTAREAVLMLPSASHDCQALTPP